MKILVTYDIPRASFTGLPADWEITFPQGEKLNKEEIIQMLPEYDILLAIFSRPIDKDMIDAGKKLKLISNYGVGYNNIDIKYAREKGITVCNTPKSVCNPTAELAMTLMLGAARRIGEFDRRIRTEREGMWGVMRNLGYGLEGKILGIIGMGHIGQNVALKAKAFGMHIIYYNRKNDVASYERTDLDTLLRKSDFISIHTPLTDKTHHLISERELNLMKPTAIIINTSRGAVIDEVALTACLQSRRIAGAALDVFEQEPHITEALYSLDNVTLVPHIGTATHDCRIAMGVEALDNIRNFLNGTPTNVVN